MLTALAVPAPLAAGSLLAALIGGGGLLGSRYGSVLLVKTSFVAALPLLGLAARHRFRLTPALAAGEAGTGRCLARSVAVGAAVAVLLLCAAARLVSTPPP